MPDFSSVRQLDLSGKMIVVSGGTQGIGAGIGRLAAHLGAAVAVIGRKSALGKELINGFPSGDAAAPRGHLFISEDLSTIRGVKQAARRVKDWAGDNNIDLLFETQGGQPAATEVITEDGLDSHFALQALSRFALPYTLVALGALKDSTVLLVAVAGVGANTVDFDNFDAKGLFALGKVKNASAVLDAFTKEFNERYSSVRVLHTHPGFVHTNVAENSNAPWFIRLVVGLVMWTPFMTRTPDQYAPIAMWLATSEEIKQKKDVVSWTNRGTECWISGVARDDKLRKQVWEKLVSLVDKL